MSRTRTFRALTASAGATVVLTAGLLAAGTGLAAAQPQDGARAGHAVFVQTDSTAGNQIVAYDRSANGALALANTYDTHGLGGQLTGSAVDHLASQGSLTYDRDSQELYAVNAGSNTVSVFAVGGDRLALRQVVSSGGSFPVSIAVRADAVYVLDALGGGAVQGYRNVSGRLVLVPGWNRALGLGTTASTPFTQTPGQVAFSPDGSQLIVTTKGNTASNDAIDVFGIDRSGRPSSTAVVNAEPGALPFAATFDADRHLVVTDTGLGSLVTYRLRADGTVTQIDAVSSTQKATCWVAPAGRYLFTGNAGGGVTPGRGSLTGFSSSPTGTLTNLGSTATDPGTVDASATPDGRYLYTQTGANGIVDELAVGSHGTLTEIGSVTVADAIGGEGIVAL